MSSEIKHRRGTEVEHTTFTGANGEITVNTSTGGLRVHDGLTVGGKSVGDSDQTVTATGTTTPRSLADRFGEIISVNDEGAIGDGVSDDKLAFDLLDSKGRLGYIPKPDVSYSFSAPTQINSSTVLVDPSSPWASIFDSGNLELIRNRATEEPDGCNIWRLSDRVFIGEAAQAFAGDSLSNDGGSSWFNNTDYAGYLAINSHVVITNSPNKKSPNYGYSVGLRSSNANGSIIGLGASIVVDSTNARGWGAIFEMQREEPSSKCNAIEIASKNKGQNTVCTPNTLATGGPVGDYGIWAAGGGDSPFGGSSANPSTAVMAILSNDNTWNSGIVVAKDGLTNGEVISMSSEGIGGSHALNWYNSAGNKVFSIFSNATDLDSVQMRHTNNGVSFYNGSSETHRLGSDSNSVNGFNLFSSATGAAPSISTIGLDADIDLRLVPKGTGNVRFGAHSDLVAETVTGYITVKDETGAIRKLAVVS